MDEKKSNRKKTIIKKKSFLYQKNNQIRNRNLIMELLAVNTEIQDFSLFNKDNQEVKLLDITSGLTLLYFYPKAMTPGCTNQACDIRDRHQELSKLGITVYGISCDSPERLQKFITKENLNFTLLSDPEHKLCSYFGAWGPKKLAGREYEGIYRVSFLIKNHKILANFPKVKPKEHVEMILTWMTSNKQAIN